MKFNFGKFLGTSALVAASLIGFSSIGHAQDVGPEATAAEVRGPSPRIMDWNRPGYFRAAVGPSFASGLESSSPLINLNVGYNYNLNERLAAKVFSDFNLGSGGDSSRWINLGVGADYYLNEVVTGYGVPYVAADVGYSFTRTDDRGANNEATLDAVAVGAGTGFKFSAADLNLDLNLHYTLLTAELEGRTPSIFGVRLAVNY